MAPRVLAVRFSSIGDLVLVTPLLRALRARHPGAYLALATKAAFAPLFAGNPRLDRLFTLPEGGAVADLAAALRAEGFTHLLDLHGSLRSRLLRTLVPGRWSGYPKHRLARALLIRTHQDRYPDRRPVPERYFAAAAALDVHPDGGPPELFDSPEGVAAAEGWLAAAGLGGQRPVALAPGAAHATKRWPEGHWAALAAQLLGAGTPVVLAGGPADRALAARVAEAAPGVADGTGRFDLAGTAALLRRCRALVSGDTGVMHMATGTGTPVVALFGPTVEQFGFFPYGGAAAVLQRDLPCRPCSSHGGPACPLGHHRCLVEIAPAEVARALAALAP